MTDKAIYPNHRLCCEALSGPYPVHMAFDRVLSLGWYDGTTSGLTRCAGCSTVFRYDIVDWDSDQERRIFLLSPFDSNEFEHLVKLFTDREAPKWPFWSPKWDMPSADQKNRFKAEVDTGLSRSLPPKYLMESDRTLATVFVAKRILESVRAKLSPPLDGLPVTNEFTLWHDYLRG